jgi:hypothetical protein
MIVGWTFSGVGGKVDLESFWAFAGLVCWFAGLLGSPDAINGKRRLPQKSRP